MRPTGPVGLLERDVLRTSLDAIVIFTFFLEAQSDTRVERIQLRLGATLIALHNN